MKPKFRNVLEMAIEQGVLFGYRRAYKHVENPTEDSIVEHIVSNVMDSLDDWFEFEDETV
jgi:hypothetical protein